MVYPEEEYVTKVNTSLVAGNPPDVAIIESDDWMKAGYVVELTDKLADWGVSIDELQRRRPVARRARERPGEWHLRHRYVPGRQRPRLQQGHVRRGRR